MMTGVWNPLNSSESFVDRWFHLDDLPDRAALGVWGLGTVIEIGFIGALAVEAARDQNVRGVVRLGSPLAIERATVAVSNAVVDRDRPLRRWTRPGKLAPSSSSFPSGHASNSFMAATLLTGRARPSVRYGLAGVVALSRIATRVHQPGDVIAGALVGVAIARVLNIWVSPEHD